MGRVENIQEGFYYTDGVNLLEITATVPTRPDTYIALSDSGEEIRIKKDKLYRIKLDEDWLSKLNLKMNREIFRDDQVSITLKKSGASFHLEINDLKDGAIKRKMALTVDELQNQIARVTGSVPRIKSS
jgi:hypothetical protein